jgi:hypothetical protein
MGACLRGVQPRPHALSQTVDMPKWQISGLSMRYFRLQRSQEIVRFGESVRRWNLLSPQPLTLTRHTVVLVGMHRERPPIRTRLTNGSFTCDCLHFVPAFGGSLLNDASKVAKCRRNRIGQSYRAFKAFWNMAVVHPIANGRIESS